MLNKGQVWRQIQAGLKPSEDVRTWSERDGFGPTFKVVSVSRDALVIAPESSGNERRLVEASLNEVIDFWNAQAVERSKVETRNSSYSLGILKHLGLI